VGLKIVLATRNSGKIKEIKEMLPGVDLLSTADFPDFPEPEETGGTFFENARIKAAAVHEATGLPALADDSGIEVDALGGAPGVRSARYGGESLDDAGRCAKLLDEMKGVPEEERTARFRCVMVLYPVEGGRAYMTEGILEGVITDSPRGENGFGYDPVFLVPETGKTAAEMSAEEKNSVSHRYRALVEMKGLLAAGYGLDFE
jgi:XTP/dITP diphosphohydrolase